MIVKILSSSASFSGVDYNTNKIGQGKGELVNISNFGALQFLSQLRPSDYINYFRMVSSVNKRVAKPQFHAVISAKGRSIPKDELTRIAKEWLSKMGYGMNPYLLIFHSDTKNNHIHAVSTRIDKSGKKISSAFEKRRAVLVLSQVLKTDPIKNIEAVVTRLYQYRFSTLAQFRLLLELKGFVTTLDNGKLHISAGDSQRLMDLKEIEKHFVSKTDKSTCKRIAQVKKIIEKYKLRYTASLVDRKCAGAGNPEPVFRYGSPLCDFLYSKFGLQFIFHYSSGHDPYGYTIVDHAETNVYKGSQVMKMDMLIGKPSVGLVGSSLPAQLITDHTGDKHMDISGLTSVSEYRNGYSSFDHSTVNLPDLADDINDEAILGRNRQRKGVARNNRR